MTDRHLLDKQQPRPSLVLELDIMCYEALVKLDKWLWLIITWLVKLRHIYCSSSSSSHDHELCNNW